MNRDRFVVVGGGLLGCAAALEIARRVGPGRVLVLERAIVGAEASSAAAGMLAPRKEARGREPFRSIGIESLGLYPGWIASLGADAGFLRPGLLSVVRAGEPVASPDPDAVWLDAAEAGRREPGLAPDVVGAWHMAEEACVDPKRLVPAVHAAAVAAGVTFRTGEEVAAIEAGAVRLVG
ncbi:MAG: NAD(P)/FAD-dependent oxidoreductase, partial [Myxococcota bacterium]